MNVRLSLLKEGGVAGGDIFEKVFFLVRTKSRVMKWLSRLFRPHYQGERDFFLVLIVIYF